MRVRQQKVRFALLHDRLAPLKHIGNELDSSESDPGFHCPEPFGQERKR